MENERFFRVPEKVIFDNSNNISTSIIILLYYKRNKENYTDMNATDICTYLNITQRPNLYKYIKNVEQYFTKEKGRGRLTRYVLEYPKENYALVNCSFFKKFCSNPNVLVEGIKFQKTLEKVQMVYGDNYDKEDILKFGGYSLTEFEKVRTLLEENKLINAKYTSFIGNFDEIDHDNLLRIKKEKDKEIKKELNLDDEGWIISGTSNSSKNGEIDIFIRNVMEKLNYAIKDGEYSKIKNAYKKSIKNGYTLDQIENVTEILIKKGKSPSIINGEIENILMELELINEINDENTLAGLVNKFDTHFSGVLNKSTFIKNVNRLKSLIDNGQPFENLKITIDYMIQNDITVFNFIDSNINKAMANKKSNKINQNTNPCFYDSKDREYLTIQSGILNGSIKPNEIEKNTYYHQFLDQLITDEKFPEYIRNKIKSIKIKIEGDK